MIFKFSLVSLKGECSVTLCGSRGFIIDSFLTPNVPQLRELLCSLEKNPHDDSEKLGRLSMKSFVRTRT